MATAETTSGAGLTAKASVEAAKRFAMEVLSNDEFRDPRLEAVELSGDSDCWLVTISYAPDEAAQKLGKATGLPLLGARSYKTVYVRVADGEILKMVPAGRRS